MPFVALAVARPGIAVQLGGKQLLVLRGSFFDHPASLKPELDVRDFLPMLDSRVFEANPAFHGILDRLAACERDVLADDTLLENDRGLVAYDLTAGRLDARFDDFRHALLRARGDLACPFRHGGRIGEVDDEGNGAGLRSHRGPASEDARRQDRDPPRRGHLSRRVLPPGDEEWKPVLGSCSSP